MGVSAFVSSFCVYVVLPVIQRFVCVVHQGWLYVRESLCREEVQHTPLLLLHLVADDDDDVTDKNQTSRQVIESPKQ